MAMVIVLHATVQGMVVSLVGEMANAVVVQGLVIARNAMVLVSVVIVIMVK